MKDRGLVGELMAEFLGTMVLISFGCGVVAVVVLYGKDGWLLINFGWGLAVMLGIYVAGTISGAHLNPAVTLALALRRGFPWAKVGPYMGAQLLGAIAGSTLVFINYEGAFTAYEKAKGINRALGAGDFGVFSTGPNDFLKQGVLGPIGGGLLDQIIGTMFLVWLILAIVDTVNSPPQANLAPFIIGLLIVAIGASFGPNAGYAINPARDLGPRIVAFLAGWSDAFTRSDGYFWVPIIGPLIGGPLGAYIYDFTIHGILVARAEPPLASVEEKGVTDRTRSTVK